jgi:hypothetical protein
MCAVDLIWLKIQSHIIQFINERKLRCKIYHNLVSSIVTEIHKFVNSDTNWIVNRTTNVPYATV